MTRIELRDKNIKEIDDLKKEIREVKKEPKKIVKEKKFSGCKFCCLSLVVVFILLVSFILAILARTGLYDIPVFSSIFYKTPKPTREVLVELQNIKSLESILNKRLEEQIMRQVSPFEIIGGTIPDKDISLDLVLSEEELTGFLRSYQDQTKEAGFDIKNPQIVVTEEEVEFFTEVIKPKKTYLTVAFRPEINDRDIDFEITRLRLGNLSLPGFLLDFITKNYLESKIDEATSNIPKEIEIDSINLQDGNLVIKSFVDLRELQ